MTTPHFQDDNVIIHKMECGPYANNIYLVVCPKTNESIFIDTPAEPDKMIELAKTTDVKAIIITHNHMDHLLGFEDVTAAIDAPVGIGADDADALSRPADMLIKDGDVISAGSVNLDGAIYAGAYARLDVLLHRGASVFRRYAVSQAGLASRVRPRSSSSWWRALPRSCSRWATT